MSPWLVPKAITTKSWTYSTWKGYVSLLSGTFCNVFHSEFSPLSVFWVGNVKWLTHYSLAGQCCMVRRFLIFQALFKWHRHRLCLPEHQRQCENGVRSTAILLGSWIWLLFVLCGLMFVTILALTGHRTSQRSMPSIFHCLCQRDWSHMKAGDGESSGRQNHEGREWRQGLEMRTHFEPLVRFYSYFILLY